MPGLKAWNEANARFRSSKVARHIEDLGYIWSIAEIDGSGRYKACIYPFRASGDLDLKTLQAQSPIKLELTQ